MIELTGTVNGKMYENQRMTPDELIDIFNLPINGADRIVFRLDEENGNVVATNLADGQKRFPVRQGLITAFAGMYKGSSIHIRYYESKTNSGKDNIKYFPNKLYFNGIQTTLNLHTSKEKAVYMMLFPWCKESPLRSPRKEPVYLVYDRVKNAKAKLKDSKLFSELMDTIMQSGDDYITQIAYGIKVQGARVASDDAKHPATARMALLEMARKYPDDTYTAFHALTTRIVGAVTDAKERKLIKSITTPSKVTWEYSDELGGDVLVELKNDGDPTRKLIEYLSDSGNWNKFTSRAFAESAVVESEVTGDPADMDNADLIEAGIKARILVVHPQEDKVYLMDENSQFDGRALMILKGARENWKRELSEGMTNIQRNRLIKRLTDDK